MFSDDCCFQSFSDRDDPVPGFQMHLDGAHLLGDVLARALYQPLAQIGGELPPALWRFEAATNDRPCWRRTSLTAFISIRSSDEDAGLSVRS